MECLCVLYLVIPDSYGKVGPVHKVTRHSVAPVWALAMSILRLGQMVLVKVVVHCRVWVCVRESDISERRIE